VNDDGTTAYVAFLASVSKASARNFVDLVVNNLLERTETLYLLLHEYNECLE